MTISPEKEKAVDTAMLQIERQFGKGAIMKLGGKGEVKKVNVIPSGSISLDIALGVGGFPRGRVVVIYGPEYSGKTSLVLHILAEAQKMGGTAALIDAEHAMDVMYARKLGVNCMTCWCPNPIQGNKPWRSPRSWFGAVPWMCWSLTRWQPWSQGQRLRATWEMPMWVCRPGSCPRR